jgi:hypothetical protein
LILTERLRQRFDVEDIFIMCCRLTAAETGEGETIDVIFHPEWFFDREGRTYESVGLRPDRLMVLCFDRFSPSMIPV